ncbi:protein SOSEKI 5-like isoform X2 [Salvia splendens]|uniref:protein SOSEKI 5-like isoform X2 n=1 Tax=Salvia splendens TaxID=180675 RepID=UPI001C260562|nr:protein SOSEKI 5-like isoform X2 [Salvia splendens]XP_042043665.1 protein SOSEKI 5-like isoform X2 [Salvia splendens]
MCSREAAPPTIRQCSAIPALGSKSVPCKMPKSISEAGNDERRRGGRRRIRRERRDAHHLFERRLHRKAEEEIKHKHSLMSGISPRTELNLDTNSLSSPPSTTSSTPSDNPQSDGLPAPSEADPIGSEPMLSRNSMLLSLIACGGTGSFRRAVLPASVKEHVPGRKSCSGGGGSSLHKGVMCKAAKMATEDERVMISYMSENPRFGNSQAEEKEYFSGSIVESMTNDCANEPVAQEVVFVQSRKCTRSGCCTHWLPFLGCTHRRKCYLGRPSGRQPPTNEPNHRASKRGVVRA